MNAVQTPPGTPHGSPPMSPFVELTASQCFPQKPPTETSPGQSPAPPLVPGRVKSPAVSSPVPLPAPQLSSADGPVTFVDPEREPGAPDQTNSIVVSSAVPAQQ